MNEKPEALRLAEWIESDPLPPDCDKAAAELRRLHAENERLREALSSIAKIDLRGVSLLAAGSVLLKVVDKAKAALRREDEK